jgi:hypothetical protein
MDELALDVDTVVDAGQQHALVAKGDAGAAELITGLCQV